MRTSVLARERTAAALRPGNAREGRRPVRRIRLSPRRQRPDPDRRRDGITPLVSGLRPLDGSFDRSVDFYYSIATQAGLYTDDVAAAAAAHPSLRALLVVPERDGRLTATQTLDSHVDGEVWIYICGPPPIMHAFDRPSRPGRAA